MDLPFCIAFPFSGRVSVSLTALKCDRVGRDNNKRDASSAVSQTRNDVQLGFGQAGLPYMRGRSGSLQPCSHWGDGRVSWVRTISAVGIKSPRPKYYRGIQIASLEPERMAKLSRSRGAIWGREGERIKVAWDLRSTRRLTSSVHLVGPVRNHAHPIHSPTTPPCTHPPLPSQLQRR